MSSSKVSVQDWDEDWIRLLWNKLDTLGQRNEQPPQLGTKCIFRVAEHIRATDPTAYEPKVVSIGPYHQNKQHLKPMDEVKLLYLLRFLDRNPRDSNLRASVGDSNPRFIRLKAYLKGVHELNAQSRSYYAEEIKMGDREFSYMLLLDGCFIVELFLQNHESSKEEKRDNPILGNMLTLSLVEFDMLLLENQIPFVVLEHLYYLVAGSDNEISPRSLVSTAVAFFEGLVAGLGPLKDVSATNFYHLLHLFHSRFIVPPIELSQYQYDSATGSSSFGPNFEATESILMTPCATDLQDVGVKFMKIDQSFSWKLSLDQGVIEISRARLSSNSNSFYRNLIMFEQHFFTIVRSKVMAYAMFMSCLIDSESDLALLRREGILVYTLDYHTVTHFFKKLCKDSVMDYDKSYLSRLQNKSMEVWKIYRIKWEKYKAKPKIADYLIRSAYIVLALTFVQAFYAILSYHRPTSKLHARRASHMALKVRYETLNRRASKIAHT